MFKDIENSDYIQKNIKTIVILMIFGFLLGLAISRFFPNMEIISVKKITLDETFKIPSYPASPQDKLNRIKE